MIIVVEGVDGAGKSTLIKDIGQGFDVQCSEGPPKYPGEMNERVERYIERDQRTLEAGHSFIYDRHPCVSNPIYDKMRVANGKPIDPIHPELVEKFYSLDIVFIYCEPVMFKHDVKPDEDPDHVKAVEDYYGLLLYNYQKWALKYAHMIYRIGDKRRIQL